MLLGAGNEASQAHVVAHAGSPAQGHAALIPLTGRAVCSSLNESLALCRCILVIYEPFIDHASSSQRSAWHTCLCGRMHLVIAECMHAHMCMGTGRCWR